MSEASRNMKNPHKFMGVPREQIDWFPTINYEKCNNCGDCVTFCAHGVYEKGEEKILIVKPKNCVVFCQACLKMCPIEGAMIFQPKKEVLKQIKTIKAEIKNKALSE